MTNSTRSPLTLSRRYQVSLLIVMVIGYAIFSNFRAMPRIGVPCFSFYPESTKDSKATFTPKYRHPVGDMRGFDGIESQVWRPAPHPLPCEPGPAQWKQNASPTRRGLLFVKTFKTGSSTAAGVHLRMALNEAKRRKVDPICDVRFKHKIASKVFPEPLEADHSFLWTVLREPTIRFISHFFFFYVSRGKQQPTDRNFQQQAMKTFPHVYGKYIGLTTTPLMTQGSNNNNNDDDDIRSYYNQIMKDYNFIAVTERWDESMVVLSMLLKVPLKDVLYTKAKGAGKWDDHCQYSIPSFVSMGMQEYFESNVFQELVHWDHQLYLAVNESLDRTIASLGQELFVSKLEEFKVLRNKAAQVCDPVAIFPCSEAGEFNNVTNCIYSDFSCANDCLNEL